MHITDFSPWASLLLILFLALPAALFFQLVDRRLGSRLWRTLLTHTAHLSLLALVAWGLVWADRWWADVLWLLLLLVVVSFSATQRLRRENRLWPLAVAAAMLVSTVAVGACLLWAFTAVQPFFSHKVVIALTGLLTAHQLLAVRQGLDTFSASMRHTTHHRQYLIASGATRLETLMPSVRRGLRAALLCSMRAMATPALLSMPPLFCGLLLAGSSPVAAALAVWLVTAATFASTTITLIGSVFVANRLHIQPN